MGQLWDNYGKPMGKVWKNYGTDMGTCFTTMEVVMENNMFKTLKQNMIRHWILYICNYMYIGVLFLSETPGLRLYRGTPKWMVSRFRIEHPLSEDTTILGNHLMEVLH